MDYADIIDYLNGHATPAGREALEAWLEASEENRRQFRRIKQLWEVSGKALQPEAPEVDTAWRKVRGRIRPSTGYFRILGRVAAVLLLMLAGYWLWHIASPVPQLEARQGGQMAKEAVILPDGSKVWLHRESVLSYPKAFKGQERLVRLSGEAYFEVAHDEAHPFLIETGDATVRVLGTSFGLMAYPDSSAAWVQVNSGKVAFYPNGEEGREVVLEKGQGAELDRKTGELHRLNASDANRIAWRTRKLGFQNSSLEEMATVVEETYGVQIVFENPQLSTCRFTASFNEEPLEAVLQALNALFGIEWRREGQVIVLNGEGCEPVRRQEQGNE
ncbi:MAG: FecR domain-containing protein [Lewinellaceae bacterium]|nr:FecR domain-containing protein [Lewinellaceae bacterium]MCB9286616.1 FecR domain-containing protein [Lewinellaceae bacterium]